MGLISRVSSRTYRLWSRPTAACSFFRVRSPAAHRFNSATHPTQTHLQERHLCVQKLTHYHDDCYLSVDSTPKNRLFFYHKVFSSFLLHICIYVCTHQNFVGSYTYNSHYFSRVHHE